VAHVGAVGVRAPPGAPRQYIAGRPGRRGRHDVRLLRMGSRTGRRGRGLRARPRGFESLRAHQPVTWHRRRRQGTPDRWDDSDTGPAGSDTVGTGRTTRPALVAHGVEHLAHIEGAEGPSPSGSTRGDGHAAWRARAKPDRQRVVRANPWPFPPRSRACSSAGERLHDAQEASGSTPLAPTRRARGANPAGRRPRVFACPIDGCFRTALAVT
jgi:hypothetical protein